jgi:hypothetical protein
MLLQDYAATLKLITWFSLRIAIARCAAVAIQFRSSPLAWLDSGRVSVNTYACGFLPFAGNGNAGAATWCLRSACNLVVSAAARLIGASDLKSSASMTASQGIDHR